jgi:hypothetical protein
MKKVYTLLLALALSGVVGSCTKLQTISDCKKDCDKTFTELLLFTAPIVDVYERQKCYNKCEGK